jgi:hypothetical protein
MVEGTASSVVEFTGGYPTAGGSVGTCECTFRAVSAGAKRWRLEGANAATLRVDGGELVIEGDLSGCCGLGWPGIDRIRIGPKPLPACTVKAKKASFWDPADKEVALKAYVVAGDRVLAHVDSTSSGYVPAVFVGPKSRTAGLLRRTDLDCTAAAKGAP